LTDENIFPAIVYFLRQRGFDVADVREKGLAGADDDTIIAIAREWLSGEAQTVRDWRKLA
jgi:predicted nuclease of predicted toxin-antitoxin system